MFSIGDKKKNIKCYSMLVSRENDVAVIGKLKDMFEDVSKKNNC